MINVDNNLVYFKGIKTSKGAHQTFKIAFNLLESAQKDFTSISLQSPKVQREAVFKKVGNSYKLFSRVIKFYESQKDVKQVPLFNGSVLAPINYVSSKKLGEIKELLYKTYKEKYIKTPRTVEKKLREIDAYYPRYTPEYDRLETPVKKSIIQLFFKKLTWKL